MTANAFGDFDHVGIEHHCSMGAPNPFKGQGIARDPLPAAILIAFDAGGGTGFGCRAQQQDINTVNFRRDVMDGGQCVILEHSKQAAHGTAICLVRQKVSNLAPFE